MSAPAWVKLAAWVKEAVSKSSIIHNIDGDAEVLKERALGPSPLRLSGPLVIEELLVISTLKGRELMLQEPAVLCIVAGDAQLIMQWVPYSEVFGNDHTLIVSMLCLPQ